METLQATRRSFRGAHGNLLAGDAYGDPAALPVLLLHGGGQTRHAWGATARTLANDGFHTIALDLRGHGESDWAPDGRYVAAHYIEDVDRVVRSFARPPVVVGASRGGMIALALEGAERPGATAGIVLVDVAHDAREDGIARIVDFMVAGTAGFASLGDAADAISGYLSHRKRPASLEGLRKNLRLRDDGRWYWHWDPRMLQTGDIGERRRTGYFERAARGVDVPVLLVRGRDSDVVDEAIARELRALVPQASYVDVAGAQHMVAGDENDAFTTAVRAFCREVAAGTAPGRSAPTPS